MKKIKMMMIVAAILVAGAVKAVNNPENLPLSKTSIPASVKLSSDTLKLDNVNGKYILLQYWSKRNANSLKRCIEMDNTLRNAKNKNVEMVMITINPMLLVTTETDIEENVSNCLLDKNGVIVARNIKPEDLAMYIQTLE
jgi:hypothetical protein